MLYALPLYCWLLDPTTLIRPLWQVEDVVTPAVVVVVLLLELHAIGLNDVAAAPPFCALP